MYQNIAVLPLDSRPCCSDFVRKIGRIGGYDVQCPPPEWHRDFIKASDTARMARWLREAAGQAEYLVVSVDMLLFGGLAPAMRCAVPADAALARLALLEELRTAHPGLTIYAAFSMPGSSTTAHTPQQMISRAQCMTYSQLSHKVLLYGRQEDRQALEALEAEIDPAALKDYLGVRERAAQVAARLVEYARDGVVDFVSFGCNDSSLYGLHRLRLLLFSAGCLAVDTPAEADVILMVNTACQGWDDYRAMEKAGQTYFLPESRHNLWDFVSAIQYYLKTQRRVAVADVAFANGCDTGLVRWLRREVDLTRLAAFGGWNTASNTLGTVVAQAAARFLYDLSEEKECASELAQMEFLMERFADEYCYQVVVRPQLNRFAEEKGASVLNLGPLYGEVNALAVEKMQPLLQEFFAAHFAGRPLTGPFSARRIVSMSANLGLPWARTFEMRTELAFQARPADV